MPVVAPHGAGALIRRKTGVDERHRDARRRADRDRRLTVRATRAEHDAGRLPFGVRAEPLGYVIEGDGRRCTSPATRTSSPGWPTSPRSTSRCSRSGAGGRRWGRGTWIRRALPRRRRSLGARLAIPIHWGTYYPIHLGLQGPPGFLATPPAAFEQAIGRRAGDRGSGPAAGREDGYLSDRAAAVREEATARRLARTRGSDRGRSDRGARVAPERR